MASAFLDAFRQSKNREEVIFVILSEPGRLELLQKLHNSTATRSHVLSGLRDYVTPWFLDTLIDLLAPGVSIFDHTRARVDN